MLTVFATGAWGYTAWLSVFIIILVALGLFGSAKLVEKTSPQKALQQKKASKTLLLFIPIAYIIIMGITVLLFALYWKK